MFQSMCTNSSGFYCWFAFLCWTLLFPEIGDSCIFWSSYYPNKTWTEGYVFFLQESAAALVFFRNRYAALVASQGLQTSNPMSWVTDLAPEPDDLYWSNICVPYRLLWIRKIALLVASILFVAFFLFPVSLTQSLVHLDKLQKTFPFLRGILKR